ncbi:hypothetical protein YC2023_033193 [Brassica napus]
MSKSSAPSNPSTVNKARSKRKMDSSVSHSDSSSDLCEESDFNLMAPLPLTYALEAPILIGTASSVVDNDLTEWRKRYSLGSHVVLRAPTFEEMASSCILGEITSTRLSLIPASGGWKSFCSCGRREYRSSGATASFRPLSSDLPRNMSGNIVNHPFAAYQEAAKSPYDKGEGRAIFLVSGKEV